MKYFLAVCFISAIVCKDCRGQSVTQSSGLPTTETKTATKGSSLQSKWTYFVNNAFTKFTQYCGYRNGNSIVSLATGDRNSFRAVTNSPSHFAGRISTTASPHTLIIGNVRYNDSLYTYESQITTNGWWLQRTQQTTNLKPKYRINVVGRPDYMTTPPAVVVVAEGGDLQILSTASSNPQPTSEFQWSHVGVSIQQGTTRLYPFVYQGVYRLNRITAEYCGRKLSTKFVNSQGESVVKETLVRVDLNLDPPSGLSASRPTSFCVDVTWHKKNAGACSIQYRLDYMGVNGTILHSSNGSNINRILNCNIPSTKDVTKVAVIMSYVITGGTISSVSSVTQLPPYRPTGLPSSAANTTIMPSTTLAPKVKTPSTTSKTAPVSTAGVTTPSTTRKTTPVSTRKKLSSQKLHNTTPTVNVKRESSTTHNKPTTDPVEKVTTKRQNKTKNNHKNGAKIYNAGAAPSTETHVGYAVAIVILVVLVIVLGFWIVRLKRRMKKDNLYLMTA